MLSKRLKTIADYVKTEDKVIDIGCDHGYLSIYLANNGCQNIIASDVNQNALNNAINNITKEKMEDKIKVVLSDGIKNIDTRNFNTLIISGMGTSTILHILEDKEKLENINKIIIQSNNDHYLLRKEMIKKGYFINDEKIVLDNKKYYIIIEFIKGISKYSKVEMLYGPILIKDKSNKKYFEIQYNKLNEIYNKIPKKKLWLKIKLKRKINILKTIINKE